MNRFDVYQMIRRRAKAAGSTNPLGRHTFRATGITAYLTNGGKRKVAQRPAGHANGRHDPYFMTGERHGTSWMK